ncbi:heptosyltransferase I [Novimethylophilus kurashikiensis]|uniref:Lipopolysaccharide heptosyltransferase 1 n=1 Tax=Novimethylophilus kurashikiensis TaxID=1825523 RepID=A0A2R5F4T9_9PROT|nr:lipopolysaccharide heptosyltransferase I [Novimethylophilus kurashikiensis]GBG13397.1 heptosyltransferase I [Novimethylophilus kurashikiensis]
MPRLLIVKTSSLGDIVHNLPAVTDIHRQFPEMQIDWAVEDGFAEIPRLHPAISEVIPVSLRRWRRGLLTARTWKEIAACKQHLQDRHYDLVLDSQGLLKSVLIASWAKGPMHGYSMGSGREPLPALFYRHRHKVLWEQQAVVRIRKLAALALGYPLPETPPDYGIEIPSEMLPIALSSQYVVALHGTSRDSKLWPIEHWTALGKILAEHGLVLVLPWGNVGEQQRAQHIATQVPEALVLPKLGLRQLANVLGHAVAAIGVDTGLVHLAAALKTPTVAIYTDTDPALTGVLGTHSSLFRNLGGIGKVPSPVEALSALNTLKPDLYLPIS